MSSNLNQLKENLHRQTKRSIPTQVFWGVIKSVNWENKTCVVEGIKDDLPFYEVSCGLEDRIFKPAIGSKCLIGSIGNVETDLYLIDVEAFEMCYLKVGKTTFKIDLNEIEINGAHYSGLVKAPELKTQLEKMSARVDGILNALNAAVPATGSPDSGAVLINNIKAGIAGLNDRENFNNIENKTVKHGKGN